LTTTTQTQVEQIVTMPILNPEAARRSESRTFCYAGRVDLVDDDVLVDWKTVADPERYKQKHLIGFQGELYALAMEAGGHPIREVQYRLITRPTIRFCGKDVDAHAYEARCVEWLQDKPGALQEFVPPINEARKQAARQWLWDVAKRIIDARRTTRWLPNEQACHLDGRGECDYLRLCLSASTGGDTAWVASEDYTWAQDAHPELDGAAEASDKEVLTYSACRSMCACEMLYYWRYQWGYRTRREPTDALWNGNIMHHGFEALARGGMLAAFGAIGEWAEAHPVLGEHASHKQEQEIAKARAMLAAAARKWGGVQVCLRDRGRIKPLPDIDTQRGSA